MLSVDWRLRIGEVWERCGDELGVQGNLDPAAAAAGGDILARGTAEVLAEAEGRRGHIFSLGHGVLKETPPENLKVVVRTVHDRTRRKR